MNFRATLHQRAAAAPRRIVFPEGGDHRTQEAVARLSRERLVQPVVLGDVVTLTSAFDRLGADTRQIELADPAADARRPALATALAKRRAHRGWTEEQAFDRLSDPLLFAGMLVRTGHADGIVAGAVNTTGDVIRAAIWSVGTIPGIRVVSSSFYMIVPPFRGTADDEVLTFTDAAVIADPGARDLADIAAAAVLARRSIVGDTPRVAFLSFSTRGSARHDRVDTVRAAFELFRAEHPDVIADGELQADAALIAAVAERKAPGSAVAGGANILVFPNLDAANIAYKLVQRLAAADALGPILQGLDRPCSDLSRGATADDIVDVACVTALQAQGGGTELASPRTDQAGSIS